MCSTPILLASDRRIVGSAPCTRHPVLEGLYENVYNSNVICTIKYFVENLDGSRWSAGTPRSNLLLLDAGGGWPGITWTRSPPGASPRTESVCGEWYIDGGAPPGFSKNPGSEAGPRILVDLRHEKNRDHSSFCRFLSSREAMSGRTGRSSLY